MDRKELWKKAVAFHGHECGGLTIGWQAARYAAQLLDLSFSGDEEVVCIAENDACGVDAIQVLLGCSVGKGNLLFRLRGKQAFSFYNRKTGKAVRLVLKPAPAGLSREESFQLYQSREPEEMFEVKPVPGPVPSRARLFQNVTCARCGEQLSEQMARLQGGDILCLDCWSRYDRFGL